MNAITLTTEQWDTLWQLVHEVEDIAQDAPSYTDDRYKAVAAALSDLRHTITDAQRDNRAGQEVIYTHYDYTVQNDRITWELTNMAGDYWEPEPNELAALKADGQLPIVTLFSRHSSGTGPLLRGPVTRIEDDNA